jgi:hypothetical protein
VDLLVLADDYEYSKGGWINRNRLVINKKITYITLPLESGSDSLTIRERQISKGFQPLSAVSKISNSYARSANKDTANRLVREIFLQSERNLFKYIFNSVVQVCDYLQINTRIVPLSTLGISNLFRRQERVIEICKNLGASQYLNPEGGKELYDAKTFGKFGVELQFLDHKPIEYHQFLPDFEPRLSILDLIYMIDSREDLQLQLQSYSISNSERN